LARYCDSEVAFNAATLGQVKGTQVFPQVTEQGAKENGKRLDLFAPRHFLGQK
jgi:hypothetical protein